MAPSQCASLLTGSPSPAALTLTLRLPADDALYATKEAIFAKASLAAGGEDISLMSRMGAICDVYDAITSNRPYKAGWDPSESLSRMASWKGHFDPKLFQLFVRMLGIYPIGSLVRLTSGRLGVVVEQNPTALLLPRVRVFYSATLRQAVPVTLIDLAEAGQPERIVGREDPENWPFKSLDWFWAGD